MPVPFAERAPAQVSLAEATRVWTKIGWLGFGGPAGQIALMHRELVEQRRWISDERFLHALNYCACCFRARRPDSSRSTSAG